MTNEQIIAEIAATIYGEEVVMDLLDRGKEIPLHTIKGWADRSYRVKKGEHGFETRLWKKRIRMKNEMPDHENEISSTQDFYLAKSYLFRADQVEQIRK